MVHVAQISPVVRKPRHASPERWQKAAERAIAEGIEVRQVNASGMWVANSGSQANVAYLLEITGTLVHSCSCPAGTFGDPCCKHAARFYLDAGLLELDDPEPDPSALGPLSPARTATAADRSGTGVALRFPARCVAVRALFP